MTATPGMEPYMYMYAIPPPNCLVTIILQSLNKMNHFVNPVIV